MDVKEEEEKRENYILEITRFCIFLLKYAWNLIRHKSKSLCAVAMEFLEKYVFKGSGSICFSQLALPGMSSTSHSNVRTFHVNVERIDPPLRSARFRGAFDEAADFI